MAWQVEWLILGKMIVKMLTHIHMMVYTWWCWHICKGEEVGDEKELVALVAELPDKSGIWRGTQRPDASGRHTGHVRSVRSKPSEGV